MASTRGKGGRHAEGGSIKSSASSRGERPDLVDDYFARKASSDPSEEALYRAGYETGDEEDFMNNVPFSQQYRYDEKTKRFVERDKKLTREEAIEHGAPPFDTIQRDRSFVGEPSKKAEVYKPPKATPSETKAKTPSKKKTGGSIGYRSGGSVKSSASKRGDGCAQRGKTRGKMC